MSRPAGGTRVTGVVGRKRHYPRTTVGLSTVSSISPLLPGVGTVEGVGTDRGLERTKSRLWSPRLLCQGDPKRPVNIGLGTTTPVSRPRDPPKDFLHVPRVVRTFPRLSPPSRSHPRLHTFPGESLLSSERGPLSSPPGDPQKRGVEGGTGDGGGDRQDRTRGTVGLDGGRQREGPGLTGD